MTKIYKDKELPKFLLDKRYLTVSVFFILTFSVLFMAIYSPFSSTAWFSLTNLEDFGVTAAFYIVALAILSISKLIMYNSQNHINFNLWKYIIWIIAEVVIISIFYTHFTYVFVNPFESSVINILGKSFGCALLIIAIPYTILTLYAAYRAKAEELQILQYEMSLSNESSMAYPSLINFYDYNGSLKLTINSDSLYYMESQDNYVKVYYESDGKLNNYMLRARTKAVEEMCADTPMYRCHRSYLVNITKIKLLRNERGNTFVVLDHASIRPIPVSKSYCEQFMATIEKNKEATAEEE